MPAWTFFSAISDTTVALAVRTHGADGRKRKQERGTTNKGRDTMRVRRLLHDDVNADVREGSLPVVEGVEGRVVLVRTGRAGQLHRGVRGQRGPAGQLRGQQLELVRDQRAAGVHGRSLLREPRHASRAPAVAILVLLVLGVRRSVLSVSPGFPRGRHGGCRRLRAAVFSLAADPAFDRNRSPARACAAAALLLHLGADDAVVCGGEHMGSPVASFAPAAHVLFVEMKYAAAILHAPGYSSNH